MAHPANVINFYSARDAHGEFSNVSPHPITLDGGIRVAAAFICGFNFPSPRLKHRRR